MFQDLDATLHAMLDDSGAPFMLRNADVSFATPDKNFTPGQSTVNLFLYEVKENRTLRDPEPQFVLEAGDYRRRMPPMRVDCAYLVTAWSNQAAGVKSEEEHQLLGEALAWLARFDTVPEQYCRGALAGQPYRPPAMVAQMDGKQNTSEFWSALGIAPRLAFTLVVTVALELALEFEVGPEVASHAISLTPIDGGREPETTYQIGGTVRTVASNDPLAGATVHIVGTDHAVQTDVQGRFTFSGLQAGGYTLQCTAEDFVVHEQTATVPSPAAHSYDVTLQPVAG